MNDPASSPSSPQSTADGCTQEIIASSENWQHTVDLYKSALEKSPNPAIPPKAIFDLDGGGKLCIIQDDEGTALLDQAAKPAFFLKLPTSQQVDTIFKGAIKSHAKQVVPFTSAIVRYVPKEPEGVVYLTFGSVRFPKSPLTTSNNAAKEAELGFIHNPNW